MATYTVYKRYRQSAAVYLDTFYEDYATFESAQSRAIELMMQECPDCDEEYLSALDAADFAFEIICSDDVMEEEEADEDNPAGTGYFELVDNYRGDTSRRRLLWRQFV